jgi:hypothetical protein
VAPVFLGRILFRGVLGVVNDNVGILHESRMAFVAIVQNGVELAWFGIGAPEILPVGFVVAEV